MSKHTPGPWLYDMGKTEALITEADGTTVVELRTTYNTTAHSALEANARLIAAAPALLASCKELLNCADPNRDMAEIRRAMALIRKVEGL